jgi:hypothetical protein
MTDIIDAVWLGSLRDAQDTKKLLKLGITHTLTVNNVQLDRESRKRFKTLYIASLTLSIYYLTLDNDKE